MKEKWHLSRLPQRRSSTVSWFGRCAANHLWGDRQHVLLLVMNRKSATGVLAFFVVGGLACTHHSGVSFKAEADANTGRTESDTATVPGDDASVESSDSGGETETSGSDLPTISTIAGDCLSADDCVLVLDYRAGFECWWPVAASWTDVSRDACLIPWKPDPSDNIAPPPAANCPGGRIPVNHSCPAFRCAIQSCNASKCSYTVEPLDACGDLDGGT